LKMGQMRGNNMWTGMPTEHRWQWKQFACLSVEMSVLLIRQENSEIWDVGADLLAGEGGRWKTKFQIDLSNVDATMMVTQRWWWLMVDARDVVDVDDRWVDESKRSAFADALYLYSIIAAKYLWGLLLIEWITNLQHSR
jgi:hypothetical protein